MERSEQSLQPKTQAINTAMLLMQCIGIVAVVFGHADLGGKDIPNFLNLAFPYYTWHMPFFIFISGYFFNRTAPAGGYILKKLKTHLLPALIVNAACGVFSMCIKAFELADYGRDITLRGLFVTPFTTGYQFYIDVSLWFVFALLVIEILACLMDRLVRGKGDIVYLVLTLAASVYCCHRCFYDHEGTRGEFYNAALRLGFLMFFFWLGVCYRRYAEKWVKKVLNYKTSLLIFAAQAIFLGLTEYVIRINTRNMDFSKITMPDGFWVALVSPITATLFFLGICYTLAPYLEKSKTLVAFGRNTRYVMYYHQLLFVVFSVCAGALIKLGIADIPGFSFEKMPTTAYYTGGNLALTCVVAVAALILPVLFCRWADKQKWYFTALIYSGAAGLIILLLYLSSLVMQGRITL